MMANGWGKNGGMFKCKGFEKAEMYNESVLQAIHLEMETVFSLTCFQIAHSDF